MKIIMLSTIAAAMVAVSATAALADGMGDDFYAIQRGEPYAGAAPVNHSMAEPQNGQGSRVFLNGYQPGYVVHHHNHHMMRRIEK